MNTQPIVDAINGLKMLLGFEFIALLISLFGVTLALGRIAKALEQRNKFDKEQP